MDGPSPLTARDVQRLAIAWRHTDDGEFPYEAQVDAHRLQVRVNDFPDEPLYSLLIDGEHAADFDKWPGHWTR